MTRLPICHLDSPKSVLPDMYSFIVEKGSRGSLVGHAFACHAEGPSLLSHVGNVGSPSFAILLE